jgi:DNA polymerase-3 subunit chi
MTQVDFYIMERPGSDVFATVCRLTSKALAQRHRIYIHAADARQAKMLDDRLWTFQEDSFIPHGLYDSESGRYAPVAIGSDLDPQGHEDVLINLTMQVPRFFSRFSRLLELVDGAATEREAARSRYCFYRDRGYMLNTHKL